MVERKRIKRQTMIHKSDYTLNSMNPTKTGMKSGAPESLPVPATQMAPVV